MSKLSTYDYAVIRVIPRVERGEGLNAGVIVFCRTQRFLKAQVQLNPTRLKQLDPACNASLIQQHLTFFPRIAQGEGPIGQLPLPDRFHWLVAPRSTIIQTSRVHSGLSANPAEAIEHLMQMLVR